MDIIKTEQNHLTILSTRRRDLSTTSPVLIIGNAYGLMPYQEPLAKQLADQGFTASWFAFSGQNDTPGAYSRASAVNDISLAIDFLASQSADGQVSIVAHCAGSLMALEYLKENPENPVQEMVIYGLLYKAARRQSFAQAMFKKMGTKETLTQKDWDYNPIEAIKTCDVPLLFCHPKDKINLQRGTIQELEYANSSAINSELIWFEKGYDKDLEALPEFVKVYSDWLLLQHEKREVFYNECMAG